MISPNFSPLSNHVVNNDLSVMLNALSKYSTISFTHATQFSESSTFRFFCASFKFLRYFSDSFTRFSSATTPSCLFYVLLNCLCFSIITIINNFTELITIFAFNCNRPFISIDFSAIVTQEQYKAIIQEKVTQQTADIILITWVCFEKQNPPESVKIDSCKRENAFLIFPGLFDKLADIKLTYRVKIT